MATSAPDRPPIARWKELCLDTASGTEELGRFWAQVIGGRLEPGPGGDIGDIVAPIDDPADEPVDGLGIALCPVPEAKSVKHRVHLDVYTDSLDTLRGLGADVVLSAEQSGFGWTVMTDPEGGEFCAFLKEPLPAYRLHGVVIDCADPEPVARWWGEAFGVAPRAHEDHGWWTLEGVTPDPVLTLDFVPVPEPKTVKNRLHWDVWGDPESFEAAGARRVWDQPGWATMADPEGNEFCVFTEEP